MKVWTDYGRPLLRVILMVVWAVAPLCLRYLSYLLLWVSRPLERRARRVILRWWAGGILRIIGVRIQTRGPLSRPPYFQVSNHLTVLDTLVLAATLGCVFVAKAEMASWPVVGHLCRIMNTIFIDRTRFRDAVRVNDIIARALDEGYGVHVYAESTVSPNGRVDPFKPALLEPAVRLNLPVYYAALSYRTSKGGPSASEAVLWHQGASFGRHVLNILRLPRIYATLAFGESPISGTDRKTLASDLCEAVRQLATPIV